MNLNACLQKLHFVDRDKHFGPLPGPRGVYFKGKHLIHYTFNKKGHSRGKKVFQSKNISSEIYVLSMHIKDGLFG